MRALAITAGSLMVLGGGAAAAQAACTDETWTGATSNAWGVASNWSPAAVPGTLDNNGCNVTLPANGTHYPVDLGFYTFTDPTSGVTLANEHTTIGALTIASGAGLVIHGESYVDRGDGGSNINLTLNGTSTIASGGSLELLATDDGVNPTPEGTHGGFAELNGSGVINNSGSFTSVSTTTQASATDSDYDNQLGISLDNEPGATAEVEGGFLDINDGNTVTNQGTWTVDPNAEVTIIHNGLTSGPTTFDNAGSYVNNGTTRVTGLGFNNEQPDVWQQQAGSVTGNTVQMGINSELNDAAGPGNFLFNAQQAQLAGTIPSGQTVTMQANNYGNGYKLNMTLEGSQVVNQGTLDFDTPNLSTDTATGVELFGSPLVNQGTVNFTSEAPHLINQIDTAVVNQHGATINVGPGTTWFNAGQTDTNDGTIAIAPGANLNVNANPFLTGPTTFVNEPDGTIAPQISAGGTGTLSFGQDANVTLGGTVSPQLVGGYVPAVGTEVQAFPLNLNSLKLTGTFASVSGNWFPDYYQEAASPAYVGLVYGKAPTAPATTTPVTTTPVTSTPTTTPTPTTKSGGGGTKATGKAPTIAKPSASGATVVIKLICSKGNACGKTTITETVKEKVKGKTKSVVVGKAGVTLKAGRSKSVKVSLNKAGKALLAKEHHLKVNVSVSVGGKVKKSGVVTLKPATKTKSKKSHK